MASRCSGEWQEQIDVSCIYLAPVGDFAAGNTIIGTTSPGTSTVRLVCISESTSIVIFTDSWRSLGRFLLRSDYTTLIERATQIQSISIAQGLLPSQNEPLPRRLSVASLGN